MTYVVSVMLRSPHLLRAEVTDARSWLRHRTFAMSCDQTYPFPQVFLVDAGGSQHPDQPPGLVPCWSHPPSLERAGRRQKSQGSMGVSPCTALVVLMLFLLVFAGLGFEAYEIYEMKKELKQVRWSRLACLRSLFLIIY